MEILAFPCNQFGSQEPGTNEEIQDFVCTRFKADYPIFGKVSVLKELTVIVLTNHLFEIPYTMTLPPFGSLLPGRGFVVFSLPASAIHFLVSCVKCSVDVVSFHDFLPIKLFILDVKLYI